MPWSLELPVRSVVCCLVPRRVVFGGLVIGAALAAALAGMILSLGVKEAVARWSTLAVLVVLGLWYAGAPGAVVGAIWGFFGWFMAWLGEGRYRAKLPSYAT